MGTCYWAVMVDWGIGVIYKTESFTVVYLLLPLAKSGASLLNF